MVLRQADMGAHLTNIKALLLCALQLRY